MNSKMLAALAALALTASLTGTGCMAQSDDADEITDGQEELANDVTDNQATEKTGEAEQACGFWGGWGGCGFPGFLGGWGGFGGCGFPGLWGGFGGCGFGGFGGFGGCW